MPKINYDKIEEALNILSGIEATLKYSIEPLKGNIGETISKTTVYQNIINKINRLSSFHGDLVGSLLTYGNNHLNGETYTKNMITGYADNKSQKCFEYIRPAIKDEKKSKEKTYTQKVMNQIIKGDFAEDDDITLLGTGGEILLSFTGLDIVQDARDFYASYKKGDGWGMALNAISFIPLIGGIPKLFKKAKTAIKVSDNVVDAVKTVKKTSDYVDKANTGVRAINNTIDAIDNTKTGSKVVNKTAEITTETIKKSGKAADKIADASDSVKTSSKVANKTNNVFNVDSPIANSTYKKMDVVDGKRFYTPEAEIYSPYTISTIKVNGKKIQVNNIERTTIYHRSPIGYDGRPVQIHHLTQSPSGNFAVISSSSHNKYYNQLHWNTGKEKSLINRSEFNQIKTNYWNQVFSNYK